jgi:hypothetical protein
MPYPKWASTGNKTIAPMTSFIFIANPLLVENLPKKTRQGAAAFAGFQ